MVPSATISTFPSPGVRSSAANAVAVAVAAIVTCPLEADVIVTLLPALRYDIPPAVFVIEPVIPFNAVSDPEA